jgi:dual specificity phosphatase 3
LPDFDFDFATDRVATGADLPFDDRDACDRLAGWVAAGITHVIDNRIEANDEDFVAAHAPGLAYLHNPADDAGQRMPDAWFDRGVDFALDGLAQPGTKVLSHCHMGINRGPSLAYAILLATGSDPVEALDALRQARPIANAWYAEDALDWWHRRNGTPETVRHSDRRRVAAWRAAHPLDVVRIIADRRRAG